MASSLGSSKQDWQIQPDVSIRKSVNTSYSNIAGSRSTLVIVEGICKVVCVKRGFAAWDPSELLRVITIQKDSVSNALIGAMICHRDSFAVSLVAEDRAASFP